MWSYWLTLFNVFLTFLCSFVQFFVRHSQEQGYSRLLSFVMNLVL